MLAHTAIYIKIVAKYDMFHNVFNFIVTAFCYDYIDFWSLLKTIR